MARPGDRVIVGGSHHHPGALDAERARLHQERVEVSHARAQCKCLEWALGMPPFWIPQGGIGE